ncbi:MAG TPA: PAS domain S-box protein [Verrucomicrobiae bacterium]|jgi:PAS domain S-box-containing protein|nr:PAS domain S-box protein [Verrucomicrobiae bacterium]
MIVSILDPTHYAFNPHAIPFLIVGVLISVLGIFVLASDRPSASSLSFCLLCLLLGWWLLSFTMLFFSVPIATAVWWVKSANAAVVFIPSMVFLFTLATLGKLSKHRTFVFAGFSISCFFLATVFIPGGLIAGAEKHFWGNYTRYGKMIYPFLVFFGAMLLSSLILFAREYRVSSGVKKKRLRILLWSFGIGYIASVDFLPALGIDIFPFGYICVFIYIVMMAQGIWRYRSVDINSSFAADQIIRTVADALLVIDGSGIVRVSNEAANRLFAAGESLVGAPMRTRGIAFFKKENLARLLCSGKVQRSEVAFHDRDQGHIILEISTSVISENSGEGMALVCIAKDITERKNAEEALRRSEEHYRLLAQNISDVIWIMDMNFKYTFMSSSVSRFRGFTAEEAMAQKVEETLTPESAQIFMKAVAEEVTRPEAKDKNGPASCTLELEFTCRSGSSVWSETKITFVRNAEGRLTEILGVARDISERRQALKALEESEDCYNDLIRQAQDAILTVDRYGYIQAVNPSAERVLGYQAAELTGHHFAKMGILSPNSVAKTLQEFTLTILGWQRQPFDLQVLRKDQLAVAMRAHAKIIRRDKDHVKVQVVLRQITEENKGHPSALSA